MAVREQREPTFRFDVDADRDGEIEPGEPGRWTWEWKAGGLGAIALPDLGQLPDRMQLTSVRLVADDLPEGVAIKLYLNSAARFVMTVFAGGPGDSLQPVLGVVGNEDGRDKTVAEAMLPPSTTDLFVRPLQLPGMGHDGLVELVAEVVDKDDDRRIYGRDRTVLRVSPWIMTPNTCDPVRVFVVKVEDAGARNDEFVRDLAAIVTAEGLELVEVDPTLLPRHLPGRADRWMQDEIEFGYVASPTASAFVVVDGPRNRGLDEVGHQGQLGADLGAVFLDADRDYTTSLDAFGNLEVSPPVTVGTRSFPLGRIVLGTRDSREDAGRKASLELRKFLYDQKVQTPFEIDSDWLLVGHVDEIISFVPGPDGNTFRLLVADPRAARAVFDDAAAQGLGASTLWRNQLVGAGGVSAEETVDELLSKDALWAFNERCSERLDGVREVLLANLRLDEGQMVSVPVLFEEVEERALAYFPDMVNHLVLRDLSIVPKPHGPLDRSGTDLLEQAFRDAVPDRRVVFIDDWLSYHKLSGEVHCGTNVLRHPIPGVNWWEHTYEGVWNAWNVDE